MEMWRGNEAHGGLYGVYLNQDGLAGCSLIQGFNIWRSYDNAIYYQVGLPPGHLGVFIVLNLPSPYQPWAWIMWYHVPGPDVCLC